MKRFQVVQDARDHVQLRVVAVPTLSDQTRRAIETAAREALGPTCRFDLTAVSDIPLTGAGKLRVVINECYQNDSAMVSV